MTNNLVVVGTSWIERSYQVPLPWPKILGLKDVWGHSGVTIDAQCEYILDSYKPGQLIIWNLTHWNQSDPKGDGTYIFPYEWGPKDKWGKLTRDLWFKKFTTSTWLKKTSAMWIKSVIEAVGNQNLLIYPIYRPSLIDHRWLNYSCISDFHIGDLRKEHGDGKGHCNQEGHSRIAMRTAADVHEKWGIQLELNRDIEHLDLSGK